MNDAERIDINRLANQITAAVTDLEALGHSFQHIGLEATADTIYEKTRAITSALGVLRYLTTHKS